jgi:protein required for attachment to host cells
MQNKSQTSLVAVINSIKMFLYEAKNHKITKQLRVDMIVEEKHHHHNVHEKRDSGYEKMSSPGSMFAPHSDPRDIEHGEAAHAAVEILEKEFLGNGSGNYKELFIVAEPKILGYMRQIMSSNLKKAITKEVAKNLVNHEMGDIDKIIFDVE